MSKRSPLLPIFLIVLVDILGFTIVIPLLALYAKKFGASSFTALALVSVYALCSLISAPVLGRLSDRFGRRPLLVGGSIVTVIALLLHLPATGLPLFIAARALRRAPILRAIIAPALSADPGEDPSRHRW